MASIQHYYAYLRPRSFVPTFLCALTGYAVAPTKPETLVGWLLDLSWLMGMYSVCLWGGTNAVNSAQDRDEGPVNMLVHPPPLPPGLGWFGLAVMLVGVALAGLRGLQAVGLAILSVALSIYYSVKIPGLGPRGKEIPGMDIFINTLGFGIMAVLFGFAGRSEPWTVDAFWVGTAFSVMGWGGIPTSQIFQLKPEDTYRTARNYSAWLGARRVLLLGPVFFGSHMMILVVHAFVRWPVIFEHWLRLTFWLLWLVLLSAACVHSLVWARSPFVDGYRRMLRHMLLVVGGQTCWTMCAFLSATKSG